MSKSSLPTVTSDIPRDLRLFVDRVREAIGDTATRRDVMRVVTRVTGKGPDGGTDWDGWDDEDWEDWLEGVDWWDEDDLPPNIGEIIDALTQHISESDIAKYLAERIDLIQIPDTRLKALNAALQDKLDALNAELTATIRELADGGTDITINGESGYTSLRALKVSNDIGSAAIAQINNVSADSGSVSARTLYGVHAAVYDEETGLAKAHARITREEFVRASEDEALASRIEEIGVELETETGRLEGLIQEERTARADKDGVLVRDLLTLTGRTATTEGQISALNEVTVNSTSANARQTARLTATVNDPNTGLAKAHSEIISVRTAYAAADQALAQQITALTTTVGDQGATVRQLDQAMVGYCSRSGYTTRASCEAAGGTWYVRPLAEAVRQVAVTGTGGTLTIESLLRASVGADGTTRGLIGLKIDHGGYVSGFGLSSQIINGQTVSHFVVNADYFAIGSPSRGNTSTAQYPFMVVTSPTTLNGVAVPAGVYMRDAFIQNGAITTAKIADAAIQSAKIATAAITTAHIQDATILAAKIKDGEINSAKIKDGSITTAKIQSLGAGKITSGAISVDTQLRSSNYQPGVQGWMLQGSGDIEFNLAGNQFRIRDTVNGQPITPFRVANGVVYINNLQVGTGDIESGAISELRSNSAWGPPPKMWVTIPSGGAWVFVTVTTNVFNYSPEMTEVHMNIAAGGVSGFEVGSTTAVGEASSLTTSGTFHVSAGSKEIAATVWGRAPGRLDPGVTFGTSTIVAIVLKR